MTLDEKIKHALKANTEWHGSSDLMWQNISAQLRAKKPWWQKQPLWLGTAVAATVALAFLIQTVLTPLPPVQPDPEDSPRLQRFSAIMLVEEPIVVEPGQRLSLTLDLYLVPELESEGAPTLLIWQVGGVDTGDVVIDELSLNETDLSMGTALPVIAPELPGTYRLVVQGSFLKEEQPHAVYAEQLIEVVEEKGR